MHFFDLPPELRLQIYSELLVLPKPIIFKSGNGSPSTPLSRREQDGLCPALLRINKKVYSEANALLYSKNRFKFIYRYFDNIPITDKAPIASFLCRIGSNAGQIRHMSIPFPAFVNTNPSEIEYDDARIDAQMKNLRLVRDVCTSIKIIELYGDVGYVDFLLLRSSFAAEALDLLDTHFKSIPSLKKKICDLGVLYGECSFAYLRKKLNQYGWTLTLDEKPGAAWTDGVRSS